MKAPHLADASSSRCNHLAAINSGTIESSKWLWLPAICVAFITLRWITIAGIGEYGMMYEQAYRLSIGQIWYRDLLSAHPPAAAYVLSWLYRLISPSLLLYNINLYGWWLASLFVGYLLLRRFNASVPVRCASVLAFSALSLPALSQGHAYFYAGSALGGLFVFALDVGLTNNRLGPLCCAGILAGLAVYTRQNIAAGMVAAAGCIHVSCYFRKSIDLRNASVNLFVMALGFAASALPIFFYFGHAAGLYETFHQLLLDGAIGKSGEFGLLARLMPRFNLKFTMPHRRLAEVLISVFAYPWLFMLLRRNNKTSQKLTGGRKDHAGIAWPFAVVVTSAILIAENFLTLWPIENSPRWLDSATWPIIPATSTVAIDLLNITWAIWLVRELIALWKSISDQTLWRAILACFLFAGAIISTQSYSAHLAPILLPLTIAILGIHCNCFTVRRLCLIASIFSIISVFSMPAAFHRLVPITESNQFAGVRAPIEYRRMIQELAAHVSPNIKHQRVLWVASYGPYSAFGGVPVSNVVPWDKTTFSPRQVSVLIGRWRQQPPSYVVFGPFWGREESQFGDQSGFGRWLAAEYSKDWCSSIQRGLCLWKRK